MSWIALCLAPIYLICAVILWVCEPGLELENAWMLVAVPFLIYLAIPIISILWFRRRRRDDEASGE